MERSACLHAFLLNDITDKITSSRKTEQLEQFYQTLVQNLPGGIAVIRFDMAKKQMLPEYISEGFAAMTGMSTDEAYALYKNDATAGVHPDDLDYIIGRLNQHLKKHLDTCESIYRLRKKRRQLYLDQKQFFTHFKPKRNPAYLCSLQ